MKRIAHALSGVRRGEQGFSMAEIVVAITFFVAAILGAASMMVSGVSLVGRSAMANSAMRLASAKIEEVKSIPFYVPSETNPADIDDSYWRFNAGGEPLSNQDQVTAPWRPGEAGLETYVGISGSPSYKRTTTIQYVYVVTDPETQLTQLEPAFMNSNWVPGDPGSGEDDRPRGGADASKTDLLHMLAIEVKVSYMENGIERTFTERALADDLMGPGMADEGVMAVLGISPNYGYRGIDNNLACRITIEAPQMITGDEVIVTLWRAGCNDIPTIEGNDLRTRSSSIIDCHFDLKTITDHPLGYYNVSVYWKRMSFRDSNLRNSFELREKAMWIDAVKTEDGESPAWGFEKQDARTLSIDGSGFGVAPAVNLRSGAYIMSGGNI
ncbi:MAG: hypothetical protein MUO75_03390, partial [Actinobacteria bacterium]|nr:hypothetical protein [Actinomycetota bacterium]